MIDILVRGDRVVTLNGTGAWDSAIQGEKIHLHALAADGAFLPDGRFVALPPVPGSLLARGFRRAVLDFPVKNEALSDELRSRMFAWCHEGFSAHNEVRVAADDANDVLARDLLEQAARQPARAAG